MDKIYYSTELQVKRKLDGRKPLILPAKTKKEFFLIHGYTGSTTDFFNLPLYLHEKFNANVNVPLLPGHGTKLEDLDNVSYNDLFQYVETELIKQIRKGKKIVIGGISLGGEIALTLAGRYPVNGVFAVCTPYKLRHPFNIPGISIVKYFKKYWGKQTPQMVQAMREGLFYYKQTHINGIYILKTANAELDKFISNIKTPCLLLDARDDGVTHKKSALLLSRRINSKKSETLTLNTEIHNPFYSSEREKLIKKIAEFFAEHSAFSCRR
jgi:esterase/lipase